MSDIKDDEKEIVLDHDYDGIQELDNPLPKWWLLTFYGAIIFSMGYYFYYELSTGPSTSQELRQAMSVIEAKREKANAEADANVNWPELLANKEVLVQGKLVYDKNCTSCHGSLGEGGIGPNLSDSYWIHGDGSVETTATLVKKGVLEKGMPPWKDILQPQDLQATVVYISSLKGGNPPNAKAPQGNKID